MRRKIIHYKNGATLIYNRAHEKNVTAILAGFLCGSHYEEGGLPHFVEHTLAEKTSTKTREEVFTERSLMEEVNYMTSPNFLGGIAYQSNKKEQLIWQIISQAFFDSQVDQTVLEKHKKIIAEEQATTARKLRLDNRVLLRHLWFMDNSYSGVDDFVQKSIGNQQFLDSVTIQDVLDFKNRHFYSDKFILCVVSSRRLYRVKKLADKYFISHLKVPTEKSLILPVDKRYDTIDKLQVETDEKSEIERVAVSICFHPTDPEKFPLNKEQHVIEECLLEKVGSFRDLVRDNGLVYSSPSVTFTTTCKNADASLSIVFTASNYQNIEKIFGLLGDSIARLKDDFITEEDVKKYKDGYQMHLDRELKHKKSAVSRVQSYIDKQVYYGDDWPRFTKRQNRRSIKALTVEKVKDFASLVLNPENNVIITFSGNVKKEQVKDISYYKNLIFKQ